MTDETLKTAQSLKYRIDRIQHLTSDDINIVMRGDINKIGDILGTDAEGKIKAARQKCIAEIERILDAEVDRLSQIFSNL